MLPPPPERRDGPLDEADWSAVMAEFDRVNQSDPVRIEAAGLLGPRDAVQASRMCHWVPELDPEADQAQIVAARAHHLHRWAMPRSGYPEGRAGYLRWRTEAKRRHADEVAAILRRQGAPEEMVDRVQAIVRKDGLGRPDCDPAVQVHEDALCLVFIESQLEELAARLGPERAPDVLARTLAKMSPAGRGRAAELLGPGGGGAPDGEE